MYGVFYGVQTEQKCLTRRWISLNFLWLFYVFFLSPVSVCFDHFHFSTCPCEKFAYEWFWLYFLPVIAEASIDTEKIKTQPWQWQRLQTATITTTTIHRPKCIYTYNFSRQNITQAQRIYTHTARNHFTSFICILCY